MAFPVLGRVFGAFFFLFSFLFSSPPVAGEKRTQQNKVYDHHCHCQLHCCTLYYWNHYEGKTAPNVYYNVVSVLTHTHNYAHTHASAQYTHVRTHILQTHMRARAHTHTHTHAYVRARCLTHTYTRARAHRKRERAERKSLRVRELKCRRITSFWESFVRVLIYLSVIY